MSIEIAVLLIVVALVAGAAVSGLISFKQGIRYRQRTAEAAMGSAEKEAERIVEDAKKTAETLKKKLLSKQRTKYISPGRKPRKNLRNAVSRFQGRNAGSIRRKKPSTVSLTILKRRKKLSRTSLNLPTKRWRRLKE